MKLVENQTPERRSRGIPLEMVRLEFLKDPRDAAAALEVAVEEFEMDHDLDALLKTLRLVARAQGGLTALARKTSISRQALSEALSEGGNPRLRTFQNVLASLGIQMTFKSARKQFAAS